MRADRKRAPWAKREMPELDSAQPGFPTEEARLLDYREEAGSCIVQLDTGHIYELALSSRPSQLPNPGDILSAEIIAELVLGAERKVIARRVFSMLDKRLQPEARIRSKLTDRGHTQAAIEAVLDQLRESGLHSDRRYAEAYCRDCLLSRTVGRRYLVQKLREKQIATDLARRVAAEILDEETEVALADRAAVTRWRKIRGPADYPALAKVVRFLMGKGFDAGLANSAARRAQPRPDEDSLF
ncbi:MAG: regulatory protein [Candidatus Krumholzibacteriia bacterium]|jgi:regulatory protein